MKVCMNWQTMFIMVVMCMLGGCNKAQSQSDNRSNIVTADIQKGIEEHIEEKIKLGDGYFKIEFNNEELNLKLVRVHTEYLANLAPLKHFACVDFASNDGDVYDIDFFLFGGQGEMNVTETTVHKIT